MSTFPRSLTSALATLLAMIGAGVAPSTAFAGGPPERVPAAAAIVESTDRLIVRLRDPLDNDPAARIAEIASRNGESLRRLRGMSGYGHVLQLPRMVSRGEAAALARRLAADPAVALAEPDLRMVPLRVPNDPMYANQWHYYEAVGGINLPAAWDRTVGSASITVGVIDTGILNHADLAGRTVAGYDFITDATTAQDGGGRDADPSDPGDYGCPTGSSASSWHGTHVAGTIGAATDNGGGVAGINWTSKIQPLRVLSRCGGYTSDIIDAMRWGSGIAVSGVPANATPSRVLNLSLGGSGNCSTSFQNAVNDVVARGTVVVVAAGNSNVDASTASPANCSNVITVAATTRSGAKAGYSNYGAKVAIAAPGGGSGGAGVLSTLNTGSTVPAADAYAYYAGTSMATPHVAGVASLMLSLNPALTPAQVLAAIKSSARAFPTGTGDDCTTARCGAGMLDAAAALNVALPPPPPPTARVNLVLPANGGTLSASSTYSAAYPPTGANNGDRRGANWAAGGGWNDASAGAYPDWLQADFATTRTVAEIDVFTIQDAYDAPVEPTETMAFSQYGITDFEVQYWTGSAWQTVPGGSVTGNNKVWRRFTFTPVSTTKIRVQVLGALAGYSRIVELEAYATPDTAATINFAAQANGGSAVASSTYSAAYPVSAVNDGDRRGLNWGNGAGVGGGWNDATANSWADDSVQVNLGGTRSISEIDVVTLQDAYDSPVEPTDAMTFSQYGITAFTVQVWNGSSWVTVPGGSVSGNSLVLRRFTFPAVSTNAVRVVVTGSLAAYSRIVEIEAWGTY